MIDYDGQYFQGTDGKDYMIGAKKLDNPMGSNDANYEVKYIEYLEKHRHQPGNVPSWIDRWKDVVGRYKASNGGEAITKGIKELQNQGIYPSASQDDS